MEFLKITQGNKTRYVASDKEQDAVISVKLTDDKATSIEFGKQDLTESAEGIKIDFISEYDFKEQLIYAELLLNDERIKLFDELPF